MRVPIFGVVLKESQKANHHLGIQKIKIEPDHSKSVEVHPVYAEGTTYDHGMILLV